MVFAANTACQLAPAPGLTCEDVPTDVCERAFSEVARLMDEGGEEVLSATVRPTTVTACLHGDMPLADVVVRLDERTDPEDFTVGETEEGETTICFRVDR